MRLLLLIVALFLCAFGYHQPDAVMVIGFVDSIGTMDDTSVDVDAKMTCRHTKVFTDTGISVSQAQTVTAIQPIQPMVTDMVTEFGVLHGYTIHG